MSAAIRRPPRSRSYRFFNSVVGLSLFLPTLAAARSDATVLSQPNSSKGLRQQLANAADRRLARVGDPLDLHDAMDSPQAFGRWATGAEPWLRLDPPDPEGSPPIALRLAEPAPGQPLPLTAGGESPDLRSIYPDPSFVAEAVESLPLGEVACRTPRSLMLHTHYGVERMHTLAETLLTAGMQTMTYAGVMEGLRRGECPPENAIIVSLDDFPTSHLDPLFEQMIQVFTDRGLVLVLGVIVGGPQNDAAWAYLRDLHQLGVEIASHTIDHPNLPELNALELEQQVSGSYRMICDHLGSCPVSFIVPYGSLDASGRVIQAAWEYEFVVGIAGGLTIEGDGPFYVGRAGPNVRSINHTMQVLEVAFGR